MLSLPILFIPNRNMSFKIQIINIPLNCNCLRTKHLLSPRSSYSMDTMQDEVNVSVKIIIRGRLCFNNMRCIQSTEKCTSSIMYTSTGWPKIYLSPIYLLIIKHCLKACACDILISYHVCEGYFLFWNHFVWYPSAFEL